MEQDENKDTAYHEAGHVVAARIKKIPIFEATIIPERDLDGHVLHCNPLRGIKLDCDSSLQARRRAESAIIVCYAGPAAQMKYSPHSWQDFHGNDDFEMASGIAVRIYGDDVDTHLERLDRIANDLIEARWNDVVIIAEALIKEQTLDQERIEEILEAAAATNSDV